MSRMSIASILKRRLRGKVVIAGIGNRECSDDGIGVFLVEKLLPSDSFKPILVFDSAEFHLSEILEENPDVVMFVDTAELGSPPGSVAIIERSELSTAWGNTHQPPLSVIISYVSGQTGADTFLLGIQPEGIAPGNHLSHSVERTVKLMSDLINEIATKSARAVTGEIP